jgi:hypothetical protein
MREQLFQFGPLELADSIRAPPLAAFQKEPPFNVSPPARAIVGWQEYRFQQPRVRHNAAPAGVTR